MSISPTMGHRSSREALRSLTISHKPTSIGSATAADSDGRGISRGLPSPHRGDSTALGARGLQDASIDGKRTPETHDHNRHADADEDKNHGRASRSVHNHIRPQPRNECSGFRRLWPIDGHNGKLLVPIPEDCGTRHQRGFGPKHSTQQFKRATGVFGLKPWAGKETKTRGSHANNAAKSRADTICVPLWRPSASSPLLSPVTR